MTTSVSNNEINYLKTSFAELRTQCKTLKRQQPAYERWSYKALDTITSVGGYIAAVGVLLSIKFIGAPLLVGAVGIGALTLAAYGIKKLIFDGCILHMHLPQKTKWWSNINFFDALGKNVNITLEKYASKYSVSRPRFCEKINKNLNILDGYINELEKNHKGIEGFDQDRVLQLKAAVRNLKVFVVALKALDSLFYKNKTQFDSCLEEAKSLTVNNKIVGLQDTLNNINKQFDKSCELLKTIVKNKEASSTRAVDILGILAVPAQENVKKS